MKYKYDIISVGDATIDTFLMMEDSDIEIVEKDGQRKAIMNWGDKLPVSKIFRSVAGNAANNAVGSSRLGMRTAFYSVFAHDVGGREILYKMKKEGVSDEYIVVDDKHGTNASTVISMKGERTILVYHEHRVYVLPDFALSSWVYLTSMGKGFESIYPSLVKYLDADSVKLGFNPGTFQLRKGSKFNAEVLKRTTLLSLNKEEAKAWVGESDDYEELCKRLFTLGPKMIALTDGRKGAFAYSAEGFCYVPMYPGKRIEATGAGDAFTTGTIAGLHYGKSLSEAMMWGAVNSSNVVLKIGPQDGLLRRHEIEQRLLEKPSYKTIHITDPKIKKKVFEMVSRRES